MVQTLWSVYGQRADAITDDVSICVSVQQGTTQIRTEKATTSLAVAGLYALNDLLKMAAANILDFEVCL